MIFNMEEERGVSLIISFFIMVIILAVVLSISLLLQSEVKVIRSMADSVVSFYLADSGIEKVLYYDRKNKPEGANRGLCSMCGNCPDDPSEAGCQDCQIVAHDNQDCDPMTCSNCEISFKTTVDSAAKKSYTVNVTANQQCRKPGGIANSTGYYQNASRAINLNMTTQGGIGPYIDSGSNQTYANIRVTGNSEHMTIYATVNDADGIPAGGVVAAVHGLGDENGNNCSPTCTGNPCCLYREIPLNVKDGDTFHNSPAWNFARIGQDYQVSIMASDTGNNCSQVDNISIVYE